MEFKILHRGYSHIRLKSPFYLTLDVQDYLQNIALDFKEIENIKFYIDEKNFTIFLKDNSNLTAVINKFIDNIDLSEIKKLLNKPIRKVDSAYSILSDAILKRVAYKLLVPYPIRYLMTLYSSMSYIKDAIVSLKNKELNMDVLDATAITISLAMNQSNSASSIMFMLELGNKLDSWTIKKSVSDLEESLQNKEYELWVVREDNTRELVKSKDIEIDDVILVSEGNEILFDGVVYSGSGMVNESSLTGESFPIEKNKDSIVYSNTILVNGELLVKVTNNQLNSRIKDLVNLMKEAEFDKKTNQRYFIQMADKVVKYNFLGAIVTYFFTRSFVKSISFLLVDFSCALKISTPVAYLSAIKNALDQKIVVKSSDVIDNYYDIDTFLFDKTGTITTSNPIVDKVITFAGYDKEEVIRVSACLEEHIHHPIANAIVLKADEAGIEHEEMHDSLLYIASRGIKSSIDGVDVVIGNHLLMQEENIYISSEQQEIIDKNKKEYNLLFLGYDSKLIAIFCISTPLRKESKKVLETLKENGKELILITGDTLERTKNVVKGLEFDKIYTDLSPQDKYDIVKKLKDSNKKVLMIGDGLNDSAAISLSDVGVVMNESADISKQMSDVILLNNDLNSLIKLQSLADNLQNIVNKNVRETIVVNSTLIGLGLFNILTPSSLSILHNLTTLKITLRSMYNKY